MNVIAGLAGHQGPCNCQSGRCLEKICPCLVNNNRCIGACNCQNCQNVLGNEQRIATARRTFYFSGGEGFPNAVVVTRRPCSCTRLCLNGKCECFQNGLLCGPECTCGDLERCRNVQASLLDGTIQRQRESLRRRNPHVFDPKYIDLGGGRVVVNPGCTCAQIHCATNRCACRWGGISCTERCSCGPMCQNPI